MKKITQKELKKMLHYDPDTGIFRWLVSPTYNVKIGDVAGCIKTDGYRLIGIDRNVYRAPRLAHLYMEGYLPEYQIDHRDGNRSNDKWKNLRHVSHLCNARNQKIRSTNKSGVTGVCWDKLHNKWKAYITMFKKHKHLGLYQNFTNAVKARWKAEKEYGWKSCNTNSSAFNYLKEISNGSIS